MIIVALPFCRPLARMWIPVEKVFYMHSYIQNGNVSHGFHYFARGPAALFPATLSPNIERGAREPFSGFSRFSYETGAYNLCRGI